MWWLTVSVRLLLSSLLLSSTSEPMLIRRCLSPSIAATASIRFWSLRPSSSVTPGEFERTVWCACAACCAAADDDDEPPVP